MNIAQRVKNYYEHEDFINNYAEYLLEDRQSCIDNILKSFKDYDFTKIYGEIDININQAEKIYLYILENIEQFTETFRGYWVGSLSIDSISFGEQCEQLIGIYNFKTKKDYSLSWLKYIFEKEDFYVSGDCAYYDLTSEGVHVCLSNFKDKNEILNIIK